MRLAILAATIFATQAQGQTGLQILGGQTCDIAVAYAYGENPLNLPADEAEIVAREVVAYFVGVADASARDDVSGTLDIELWRMICEGSQISARSVVRP
jgi:hypothetical protein